MLILLLSMIAGCILVGPALEALDALQAILRAVACRIRAGRRGPS